IPIKRSRKTSKRTVIQPRKGDRRYLRRNKAGQFKKEVNVGRSLAADRHRKAKTKVAKSQGDRGDTKRGGNVLRRLVRQKVLAIQFFCRECSCFLRASGQ